jgi:hypothetical protein
MSTESKETKREGRSKAESIFFSGEEVAAKIQPEFLGSLWNKAKDLVSKGECVAKCGVKVASCASSCIPNPVNVGCVTCLGPLYDTCKKCF